MALAAPAVLAENHMTEAGDQIVVAPAPTPEITEGDVILIGLLAALAALARN